MVIKVSAPLAVAVTPAVKAPAVNDPPDGAAMMKRPAAVPAAQVPDSSEIRLSTADTAPLVIVAPSAGAVPLPAVNASSR